jgi:hypothetical protein
MPPMCRDPIVIEPPGFDQAKAWEPCNEAAKHVQYADGGVNWRAAFSADPGVCSCPCCGTMHWAWGRRQRCTACGWEYPTDWWGMYAWGCAAAEGRGTVAPRLHRERLSHPYYRHGFEHPAESPWDERLKVDWRAVLAGGAG